MQLPHYEPFYIHSLDELRAEIERLGLEIPLAGNLSVLATPFAGIPNRFCAQPISGLDAGPDGAPGPLTRRRYQRLAAGGFGLVWVESAAAGVSGLPGKLGLHDDSLDAFHEFVDEIRDAGRHGWQPEVKLVAQLAAPVSPYGHPGEIPDAEIEASLDAIVHAAGLAARAGFDGVDILSGHGALPGVLLAAIEREGPFGGSLENRSRFLCEALGRIRADNPGLLTAARICAYTAACPPLGFGTDATDHRKTDPREPAQVAVSLHAAGLDLLNVTCASPRLSGPVAERGRQPVPDHGVPDEHPLMVLARQLEVARSLRAAAPGLPVIGSGFSWLRQFLPEVAAAAVGGGAMDLVGLGRGALACPDAPARILDRGGLDPGSTCMVCFACEAMLGKGGPVGCPVRDPEAYGVDPGPMPAVDPGRIDDEARRCHLCEAAPCIAASRTGTEIPAFIEAYRRGDEQGAYEIIRRSDVLPEMSARLTPGWLHSEGACLENHLSGTPVPILDLQYAIAWGARERGETAVRLPDDSSGRAVAIVGAGPAGLAAAVGLLERGHVVELHECSDTLGGTPERVIPKSRFPSARPEVDALLAPAIEGGRLRIHHGRCLGRNLDLDALDNGFDAVLLALGVWQERRLAGRAPEGEVLDALSFLEAVKQGDQASVPPRVGILAGGDCAMDAARCAEQLGASEIFIIFRGPRSEMHWHMREDWFGEPGHHAVMECEPLGYDCDSGGRLRGLRVRHGGETEESILDVGMVIEAMGLQVDEALHRALPGVAFTEHGLVALTAGSLTTRPGVHAAGGLVNGGASVARCIAEGSAAARQIHTSPGWA